MLELVEGETLAERIQRGPIPVEEALDIAKHMCEALEAAHEKGLFILCLMAFILYIDRVNISPSPSFSTRQSAETH